MPRKKISLEEAYAVFEQHGLQVEVKGIASEKHQPLVEQKELFTQTYGVVASEKGERRVGRKTVRILLATQQTVASAGEAVYNSKGDLVRVDGQAVHTYGP